MKIFARRNLLVRPLPASEPALLLEGSWPEDERGSGRWSLDDSIDARHGWIDREASRLAEVAATVPAEGLFDRHTASASASSDATAALAYLNALKLRYHLVKLLRLIAFFEQVQRPRPHVPMELFAERGRDEGYALLLRELSRRHGFARAERWTANNAPPSVAFAPNALWRRAASGLTAAWEAAPAPNDPRPRVMLCGNPRLLDPLCRELLRSDCRVWWLYDRWAARCWARWRAAGVRQLTCDSSEGTRNRFANPTAPARLVCRGIDLARPLEPWLRHMAGTHGMRQTRMLESVMRHFAEVRPNLLILDEDATPLPRAAAAAARRYDAVTAVLQHGAPCIRFGFAPPVVDRVMVWGEASRQQLLQWGVPSTQVAVTGSPAHDGPIARLKQSGRAQRVAGPPRVVLLATVPPSDTRPDAVAFHLTTRTHDQMLAAACEALSRFPDAELIVKLHPRTADSSAIDRLAASHPGCRLRVVRGGSVERLVRRATCVVSCASSAGVEALLSGVPVIQLLPQGSSDLMPAATWGLVGTARTADELEALLRVALDASRHSSATASPPAEVFANLQRPAARRIVDELLELHAERLPHSARRMNPADQREAGERATAVKRMAHLPGGEE